MFRNKKQKKSSNNYNEQQQQQQQQPQQKQKYKNKGGDSVYRIKPYHFVHVVDNNEGITRVECGPKTFTRKDHETVIEGPREMIIIPPRSYCIISNPVQREENGEVVKDKHGNYKLKHGDEEIRFHQQPFPLYPGEKLHGQVHSLQVVEPNSALKLRCIRDFESEDKDGEVKSFVAGDEWFFEGPGTYIPRIEVQVADIIKSTVIGPHQALLVRAKNKCIDYLGNERKAGEEWLVRKVGDYLPGIDEEKLGMRDGHILTEKIALHLRATKSFTDTLGNERKAGEEWLVTHSQTDVYIVDVYEDFVNTVPLTTLTANEYCVVLDPVGEDGKPQLGKKELRKGEISFFLNPGESLENDIQAVEVLSAEEALLLKANEEFDDNGTTRLPGDRWTLRGPCDYVPPVQVIVLEKRRSIPLDVNEGIYVRNIKTGKIRAVIGESYLLNENEELFEKDVPDVVERLLSEQSGDSRNDKSQIVRLHVPHNAAVQIYDYKAKVSRVRFGPELVLLGPDEHFTVLDLSGGKPKRPHMIQSLYLLLGPDFMTDIVTVETSDHARLRLKLSYNWQFDIDKENEDQAKKLFSVPDFVGDACKAIASRVRGVVASVSFDDFHKNSARVIRTAVFGTDENGKVKNRFLFKSNNLVITNIDIQSVEPVDQRTSDSLQKSVQLAIEITTKSQEASARHEAQRLEQDARGRLERQKISDEAENEKSRRILLELQAKSGFIESTGAAAAEAKAKAEAAQIEGQSAVEMASYVSKSKKLEHEVEILILTKKQETEIEHKLAMQQLEIQKAQELAAIENKKFKDIINAIGSATLSEIARAGPETQAKLLEGLGIKSMLISDGTNPINLFNTSKGLIGNALGNNNN